MSMTTQAKERRKCLAGKTEYYYYNAGHLAYVTDGNNNVKYSFTRNQAGKLIAMTDHTGATDVSYYYVLNSHGDVIGLKDINGDMVVSYEYDAYGNILNPTETGTVTIGDGTLLWHANPFRYGGYYYDEETWMYYLNARYYKPQVGRFITRDIIADKNLYQYSGDNPVMYVDPSGYDQEDIGVYAEEPINEGDNNGNTDIFNAQDVVETAAESIYAGATEGIIHEAGEALSTIGLDAARTTSRVLKGSVKYGVIAIGVSVYDDYRNNNQFNLINSVADSSIIYGVGYAIAGVLGTLVAGFFGVATLPVWATFGIAVGVGTAISIGYQKLKQKTGKKYLRDFLPQ